MQEPSATYLSDIQLAARLGISRISLQRWRAAGKGPPYYKIGGHVRYAVTEVDAWLAACRVGCARSLGALAAGERAQAGQR